MTIEEFTAIALSHGFKFKPADSSCYFPYLIKGKHRYVLLDDKIRYEYKERKTKDNPRGWLNVCFADVADLFVEGPRVKGLGRSYGFEHPLDLPNGAYLDDPIIIATF